MISKDRGQGPRRVGAAHRFNNTRPYRGLAAMPVSAPIKEGK
jgi:hypothetical protein